MARRLLQESGRRQISQATQATQGLGGSNQTQTAFTALPVASGTRFGRGRGGYTTSGRGRGGFRQRSRPQFASSTGGTAWESRKNIGLGSTSVPQGSKCHYCGKGGHWKKDCHKRRLDKISGTGGTTKGKDFTFLAKTQESLPGRGWIIDSGASQHLSHDRSQFLSNNKVTNGHSITIVDGTKIHAHGMGDIKVTTQNREITLRDVWHVPNIGTSLLSVARIMDAGYNVEFGNDLCFVSKSGVRVELGYRHGSLNHVREDSPA